MKIVVSVDRLRDAAYVSGEAYLTRGSQRVRFDGVAALVTAVLGFLAEPHRTASGEGCTSCSWDRLTCGMRCGHLRLACGACGRSWCPCAPWDRTARADATAVAHLLEHLATMTRGQT